ncbi:MAG: dynamin family protein, partial [Lentisphaeria bacterium]|nr:dynamin family protein [Lentisphaeria bacterium]
MNALEQVEQIARKYEINSLSDTIEKIRNTASIKIAFLGEFSAGKSSLINSILGTHLPTDILPTTKAICLIEPTEGITETEYFKETDGIRSSVSFGEFSEIVSGEKEDVAGMLIAPCKVLPMGSIFIDTPGFHTAVGKEAQQTFSYLSMIDAAVLCINIAEGVINAQVMDFLTDQAFSMIQNHIVFALTGSDRKSPA